MESFGKSEKEKVQSLLELSRFCHVGTKAPVKVGSYPIGMSTFGVNDLAGNVWEWLR